MIDRRSSKRPLTCRQVRRVLQSYLDGVLDDTLTREVARHLETCRQCGREAADYQEIKRSLRRRQRTARAVQRLREFGEDLRDNHEN